MVSKVHILVPKRQRVSREAAAKVLALLDTFGEKELPGWVRGEMGRALTRVIEPLEVGSIWPGGFAMLSRIQTKAVWDAIRALSPGDRPQEVRHAFDLILLNLRQDTGEVMLTRDQIAAEMRVNASKVSQAMSVLERLGVIFKERRRVEGMRGPGIVAYFVNPHVAWNGSLEARQNEAKRRKAPPLLRLMEGGADNALA